MSARPPLERRLVLLAALCLGAALACGNDASDASANVSGGAFPRLHGGRPEYVDEARCVGCHPVESQRWRGSHHDRAMQPATADTVLGDFNDATFQDGPTPWRFFRRGERFFVETAGPDGEVAPFEILYTFGVEPLQQYLVALPGGRLQCLTVAWDPARERWFDLQPDDDYLPGDPLHWSGIYQNWNSMCADCHSTRLVKGYDRASDTYHTTYERLNVGCQACHGPGAGHLAWAATAGEPPYPSDGRGFGPALRRGDVASQIDACAPCHSRRARLTEDHAPGTPFLDAYLPERIHQGMYFASGEIQDEVYVYGSFAQSRMHHAGVACTDCHDPHSLELLRTGNALCTQCHSPFAPLERFPTLTPKVYDGPGHHFHAEGSEGARCVSCHMPATTYMEVDPRRDHGFRIPRPDLSIASDVPDACSGCHPSEGPAWAADRIVEWYGPKRPPAFTSTLLAGRAGAPEAGPALRGLVADPEAPAILRATALDLLGTAVLETVETPPTILEDPSPLVRGAAARGLRGLPAELAAKWLGPLLDDPSRAVRVEAARTLVGAQGELDEARTPRFERALDEFRAAQERSSDHPFALSNLAGLATEEGRLEDAEALYRRALEVDPYFLPARFNLGTFLNLQGRNAETLALLAAGIELVPEEGELRYSYGLALAEEGRLPEAAHSLAAAAQRLPDNPRVHYNLGLARLRLADLPGAERSLLRAHQLAPSDPELLYGVVTLLLQQGEVDRTRVFLDRLAELVPGAPVLEQLEASLARLLAEREGADAKTGR